MKIKKINKAGFIKIVGLIIFVLIIIFKIDFKEFYQVINNLNPFYLIAIGCITSLVLFIKIIRWHYILKILDINCSFIKIYKIYYISSIIGIITPAYVGGSVAQVAYLKGEGHQISSSLLSVIIDRLSDIIILLSIAIIGIIFFLPLLGIKSLIITSVLLSVIILTLLGTRIKLINKIFKKIFFLIIPKKIQIKLKDHLINAASGLKKMTAKDILIISGLTILAYSIIWFFLYFLAKLLGITQIHPLFLLLIYVITRFVIIIPVTIAGFGTREITILTFFSLFSVSNEIAIVYSLLMTLVVLVPIFLIGLYFWITEPLLSLVKNK